MPVMRIVRATGRSIPAWRAPVAIWLRSPTVMNLLGAELTPPAWCPCRRCPGALTIASRRLLYVATPRIAEHQRRGLHAALGVAFAALHAGTEGHVAVARTVDHGAGPGSPRGPALLSMTTPFTASPSLTTSVQKAYSSTSTPASSSTAVRAPCASLSSGIDDRQTHVQACRDGVRSPRPAPAAGR